MKIFQLHKLDVDFATRQTARSVFVYAQKMDADSISLRRVAHTSRSFLDELVKSSQKNNVDIVEVPNELKSLYDLILKSRNTNKAIAPSLNIRRSKILPI